jgi:Bacterial Ig domain
MARSLGAILSLLCAAALHGAVLDVEGPQDSLDGPPLINHCTLRKAVRNANLNGMASPHPQCLAGTPGLDTITIPAGMTITFALAGANEDAAATGDLDITDDLIIQGNGAIIDGADLDHIFQVHPGVTLTIYDVVLRNGRGNGGGGGINASNATVNLVNVTITGCEGPNGDGGAIAIEGTLTMTNCTISGNTAAHYAGGVILAGGTADIKSSTITGNSSGFSNLTGGYHSSGTTTLQNTVIAGNSGLDLPNAGGFFISAGHNIIGSLGTNPAAFTMAAGTGDQIGVADALLNFGPLQNNGGLTPTHALNAGSIALDAGHSGGVITDQRAMTRPCDNAALANATAGDGADVGAFEEQVICSTPNAAPDAVDDAVSVAEDSGTNMVNVLTNDSDANGDPLTVTAVGAASNGTAGISGGVVTYAPNPDFFGSDSFTYTISDGTESDTATVTVTVTNVNDAPVAAGESYNMNQDSTLTVPAPGVLANDTDIDGPALGAVLDSGLPGLTLNPNGGFSYTPPLNFAGDVSFTYHASDGVGSSNTVTVTIHVADTQPPAITASTAISAIWPPNSKLIDVGLTYSATDNSSAVTTSFAVYSDEDDVTPAGGEQSPDASGALRLRADRNAKADGRVYLIRIVASDAFSNTSHSCLTVTVPKSQSAADVAGVNAQAAAAQAACTGAGMFPVGDGPAVGPHQ